MMRLRTYRRVMRCGRSISRKASQRGVSALEFALTLPILIALLVGTADTAYMLLLSQRVDRIAYSVTDILTQSESLSQTDITTTMLAAAQLMQPFPFGSDGIVIVTSLYKPSGLATKICWQQPGGGTLPRTSKIGAYGAVPTLPSGLTLNDNENVIVSEVYYAFKPMFINAGYLEADDMYRIAVYKPRLSKLCDTPQ